MVNKVEYIKIYSSLFTTNGSLTRKKKKKMLSLFSFWEDEALIADLLDKKPRTVVRINFLIIIN